MARDQGYPLPSGIKVGARQQEGDRRAYGEYIMTYKTEDHGEAKPRHVIETRHPSSSKSVGRLSWYGKTHVIDKIDVDQEHGRKGIATAMWNWGQEMTPKPNHSGDRTQMGDAWARSTGDSLPRRSR